MNACILGAEEGRTGSWLATDPSRHGRASLAVNIGSLSKQKAPMANDPPANKDAVVSYRGFRFAIFSFTHTPIGPVFESMVRPTKPC